MGMKALVIGAGGVGRAIANIASRRKFITSMVVADRTLARAEEAVVRLKDPRFSAAQVNASELEDIRDLIRKVQPDVVINADAVLRLFALSIGKDITAGIYPRRGMDRKFFLDYYLNGDGALEFDEDGMLRVRRIGTGFMMIQRHVLETMIANHPEWGYYNNVNKRTDYAVFDLGIMDNEYYGEDYLFCDRAGKEGFTVYLDPSISLPHVGSEKFTRDFEEDVLKPLLEQHCTPKLKVVNG